MTFVIHLIVQTPQGESSVDIAEDLRNGLEEFFPKDTKVLFLKVEPGKQV